MTDPEIEYQRLISGDAAALRSAAETIPSAMDQLVMSVRRGAKAVRLAGDNLAAVANDYAHTDGFIGSVFRPR